MSRPRGRPFEPGNTAGRGRPKGSRNKEKAPAQALLVQYSEPLTKKAIQLAMNGNVAALRMCLERITPVQHDAPIRLKLPTITTVQDVDRASEKVTRAMARGNLTPSEGAKMMSMLESRGRILQVAGMEDRIAELEARVPAAARIPATTYATSEVRGDGETAMTRCTGNQHRSTKDGAC